MRADQLIGHLRAPDQRDIGRVQEAADYGDDNIDRLAALDASARAIRGWDPRVIPGLLQTPEYSKAVIQAANPRLAELTIRKRALLKSARTQAFLARTVDESLDMAWFIIPEIAIVHSVWDTTVHALQLRHLLTLSAHAKVIIQVLPVHKVTPSLADHFLLYTFEGPEGLASERIGYVETVMGGYYSTRMDDTTGMHAIFAEMIRASMTPEESRQFIREVLDSWRAARRASPAPTEESGSSSPATPETTASVSPLRREP